MQFKSITVDLQIAVVLAAGAIAERLQTRRRRIPHAIIANMPPENSRALLLSIAGLSYRDIAIITDVTDAVALQRIGRAYVLLQRDGVAVIKDPHPRFVRYSDHLRGRA